MLRSAVIANAVTSEEVVATWRLQDLYAGTVPESTWAISLPVLVENAGGAQVNFTVEVAIGSNVYVGELRLRRPLSVRARARSASTSLLRRPRSTTGGTSKSCCWRVR